MTTEQIYFEEQEYKRFQELINGKEYLTTEEKEFCEKWDREECNRVLNYIGDYSSYGDYLNINVYSEHEHHEAVNRMEKGI